MHSRPNDVYRLSYVGVPCIRLGYADMNFLLAEAVERGWITGSAKQYYEEGIRASFLFVRTTVPAEYNNGVEITDDYITSYLKGEYVAYNTNGSVTDRLKQIWMQAFLARYFHMATDDYYEYRRNGYPEFPINPETNLNNAKDKIPMRYMYPESETNYNKESLYKALDRQWGGVDDVNSIMASEIIYSYRRGAPNKNIHYIRCLIFNLYIYIMNKNFFILTIIHLNIFCISAQIYPVRPQLSDKHSFSMILLPDPQSYNKFDANQPLFELQTAWIANSIEPLNIKGVLCTGDLVEQNEIRIPDGINGNQTSEEQWQAASRAFERLDDKISYVVCTGNHDYGYEKAENRLCHLPDYFPSERNSCWKKSLVETGLNYQGIPTLENAAYEFETDTWGKLLVISLEFAPRDEAIEWAVKVAGKAKYKNHKVILLTHSYMSPEAKRHIKESYKISPANYGEAIWQKLVYPSSNICMVICGHECEIADYKGNVSFRTDKNSTGKNVAQMMFNAQTADGQWHGNGETAGSASWSLCRMERRLRSNILPLFALSPLTSEKAWRTDSYDQFDITIE